MAGNTVEKAWLKHPVIVVVLGIAGAVSLIGFGATLPGLLESESSDELQVVPTADRSSSTISLSVPEDEDELGSSDEGSTTAVETSSTLEEPSSEFEPAETMSLFDLSPQNGYWESEELLSINGVEHARGASVDDCWTGSNPDSVVYTLSKKYELFTGVVGMRDETAVGAGSSLNILINGEQVESVPLSTNSETAVEVDVSDAVSLAFEFIGAAEVDCGYDEGPALGTAVLTKK